ncbi:ABC transporter permease subunit [Acinetobacter variabilis]|uniref:ABC transporter permease subunit n=1 Tax=Acinetobacter variabilis TaxID=70346 RepID=UPI0021CF174B|nr:ABC transporter permease subunit [Acinetobacter variabilis]MCU4312353.1 ABC transporter permease subunit [Acinetobacter variabilis]
MSTYIVKRLLLMIPTLLMVLLINFVVIQLAPGGPVEQAIYQAQHANNLAIGGLQYQGQQGLTPEMLEQIKIQYGFDQPVHLRFWEMLKSYAQFDLGQSFFKGQAVTELIWEKLPVSLSLGFWSTLLIYLVSIPLGIQKAKKHGSLFDQMTSLLLAVGYAIPAFIFAILLIVFFAGGSYLQWFPLQGLSSENFAELSLFGKIQDYFWHMALPLLAMVLGGFARLTYLVKFSFMEELSKQYVLAARAKGLQDRAVLYRHVLRNAVLVLVASLPEALLGILFVGNLFIEIIFNLDGLGMLGFEAILQRDYPVIFGTLFIFTLLGLVLRLISDVLYRVIDPRIHFDSRGSK